MPHDQAPIAAGDDPPGGDEPNPSVAAAGRDRNAETRDQIAEHRDRTAEDRDRTAEAHETSRPAPKARANEVADGVKAYAWAVGERAASADDRRGASDDRAHSADDRRVAASDRLVAAAQLSKERDRSQRLDTQLANLADNDPVTGLLNRSKFEEALDEHLARSTRYGAAGSLLLVRLEGLDRFVRNMQQADADELLAALADRLVGRLRETDVVGRWGPDELAILLPMGNADRAEPVAGMLHDLVAGTATGRVLSGSLVASIGVAPLSATSTAEQVVAHASQAIVATRRGEGGSSRAQ